MFCLLVKLINFGKLHSFAWCLIDLADGCYRRNGFLDICSGDSLGVTWDDFYRCLEGIFRHTDFRL